MLRQNGNTVHKGRGIEAQYSLTPSLTFSEQDAGRGIAGILGMIPVVRDLTGLIGLAEQVKFKEAQVALLLTDNETTEQLAAATGSVKVTDVGVGGLLPGRPGGISGIGWSNSNERQSDHRRVFRRAQQTGHPGARDAGHRAAAAEPGDGEEGVALTGSR